MSSTDRIKISSKDGVHSLAIDNADFSDNGQYSVKASNKFGRSQYTATLLIKGDDRMPDSSQYI